MASKKIKNDKYYTSPELARYCVSKTKEIIGEENITEWLEPSGGNGVFLDYLPKGTYSCDIEPEDDRVETQDYLELEMEYKKGRCIIGNPPFGFMTKLAIRFFNKSVLIGEYIVFILPMSFKDNVKQAYKYDLIYSEDLGVQLYSDRNVHCCLNIYKKPINGLNSQVINNFKLKKDVKIIEVRQGNKRCEDYDYAICSWGSVGKEISNPNSRQFAKEFYIKIVNDYYRNDILKLLKDANWIEIYNMNPTYNLLQWQVYKYLKEQIPELE